MLCTREDEPRISLRASENRDAHVYITRKRVLASSSHRLDPDLQAFIFQISTRICVYTRIALRYLDMYMYGRNSYV